MISSRLISVFFLLSFPLISFGKTITVSCYDKPFTLVECSRFYDDLICTYSGDYPLREILSDGYGTSGEVGNSVVFRGEAPEGCPSWTTIDTSVDD